MRIEQESSPNQEKHGRLVVSLEDLERAFEGFASPIKNKVLKRLEGRAYVKSLGEDAVDEFLEEVSRRVFGFTISELNSTERAEMERIKSEFFGGN